jgi:hypothetical protein
MFANAGKCWYGYAEYWFYDDPEGLGFQERVERCLSGVAEHLFGCCETPGTEVVQRRLLVKFVEAQPAVAVGRMMLLGLRAEWVAKVEVCNVVSQIGSWVLHRQALVVRGSKKSAVAQFGEVFAVAGVQPSFEIETSTEWNQ